MDSRGYSLIGSSCDLRIEWDFRRFPRCRIALRFMRLRRRRHRWSLGTLDENPPLTHQGH